MRYIVIPVTPFEQNCTIFWCEKTRQAVVIDPGGDIERIQRALRDESLTLACASWRDTWTESLPLAKHAKQFIDLKTQEARRRRETSMVGSVGWVQLMKLRGTAATRAGSKASGWV